MLLRGCTLAPGEPELPFSRDSRVSEPSEPGLSLWLALVWKTDEEAVPIIDQVVSADHILGDRGGDRAFIKG